MASLTSFTKRTSCFLFIIIFFFFFSVHALNSRSMIRLRNAGSAEEFFPFKIEKKVRPTMDTSRPAGAELIGDGRSKRWYWKPINIRSLQEEMKYVSGRTSDVVPFRFISLERSLPWHVPRKKPDKYPGFSSDYSRPRIRPPSHN